MHFDELHPYVYYATRYEFSQGQESLSRMCYTSSLYLISEGKGVVTTEAETISTGPGSLIFIPAGQKHDWIADQLDPMVHVCCYFDWTYMNRMAVFPIPHIILKKETDLRTELLGPSFPYSIATLTLVEKPWIWMEFFEKFYTLNEYTNEKTYMRNLKVQQHFQLFIEFFLTHALKEEHIPDPRINKLLEQLDHDLLRGYLHPLEVYVDKLRISRGYFFELFKQVTGMSPLQYINLFRINRTKDDLQFTTLTITEIAEKHHFSSIHYYSKLFRQLTGKTPKQFRNECKPE